MADSAKRGGPTAPIGMSRRTVLIISQVFVPDPASVGQHMADAAIELAARGHRVVVFAADRGYEDPARVYPRRERIRGVEVHRLPFSSFGKSSMALRLLGGLLFVLQAMLRGLAVRGVDTVLVSTSPPMASIAGIVIARLRRAALKYWVMDLNPDQAVALGVISASSPAARVFDALNRAALARASDVLVLDGCMARRVHAKCEVSGRMMVLPPWPHEDALAEVPHTGNPFRREHGLDGRRVVMYSGNHSPSHPLATLLQAAAQFRDDDRLRFLFVGGGAGKREVEASRADNVLSLPYQPLERLRYSLSAADVHVVSMGDDMVGIVHPCKAYGAMAVARPILLLGPAECHVAELLARADIGWRVAHGDVPGAVRVLREIADAPQAELEAKGRRARDLIAREFGKARLCGRFCDVVDGTASAAPRPSSSPSPSPLPWRVLVPAAPTAAALEPLRPS